MLSKILTVFRGDKAARTFKRNRGLIDQINGWYEKFESLSDEQIGAKTAEFRGRLEKGATLDDLLPEAFAAVKQACRRLKGKSWEAAGNTIAWEMVPYDVQLAGGIELHRGNIAEMATGEGKTLVAVAPLYLNALAGRGAHLITVNDYLAKRDGQWMGRVFQFLGMTVGCILTDMEPEARRVAYHCDVTYGTNNEFGFDYLRDNMAHRPEHLVQREHFYAIVDEVDSVLIDESRTPLIISGAVDRTIHQYSELKPLISDLVQKQSRMINNVVAEAEDLLKKADKAEGREADELLYEAGIKLLQARRGHPTHKRLTKVMGEASMQRLVERVEHDYMRDKRMSEIDEDLYFAVDEKGHTIDLSQKGREELSPGDPELYSIPDLVDSIAEIESRKGLKPAEIEKLKSQVMAENETKTETIHCLSQLLRAYVLYEKDRHYVINDNKVMIVDEFTGRMMAGRRWSDGLHQAVEAKENVKVEKETQTLATITLQNYFRMYDKLAGMTGTAETEAAEFGHTYKMDVSVIPTNRPIRRFDDNDLIYKTQREKFNAAIEWVEAVHASGMPILIGTVSVESSEKLSRMLKRAKISHSVLNARQHQREAEIVRDAGLIGAVTIATNMAGRGTDIKLGPGVVRCRAEGYEGACCEICPLKDEPGREVDPEMIYCGLHIIGTERHESRRIDRQLRGRSGRQGDPGYSRFYVSLEDDLMRLFASERMANLMGKGFEEGEAMSHGIATRAITQAQKRIEEINFERRKNTLKYDNVMNKQRGAIYGFRRDILLATDSLENQVMEVTAEALAVAWEEYGGHEENIEDIDHQGFLDWVRRHVPAFSVDKLEFDAFEDPDDFFDDVIKRIATAYAEKVKVFGERLCGDLSRFVLLRIIDANWRDHLLAVDMLREGIHLRSYGQLDPLTEYQKEATHLFEDMMFRVYREGFEHVFRATLTQATPDDPTTRVSFIKADAAPAGEAAAGGAPGAAPAGDGKAGAPRSRSGQPEKPKVQTYRRQGAKVGRNDPCPCGSGKKYKSCCGRPESRPQASGDPPPNGSSPDPDETPAGSTRG